MEILLQSILLVATPFCMAVAIRRTGAIVNPVTLLALTFFAPMLAATFRLSGLQSPTWSYNTHSVLIISIGAWLLIPTITIACFYRKKDPQRPDYARELSLSYRVFAALVFSSYFYANIIQAGTPIPLINPETAFDIHHEFPDGVRLLARCTPAVGVLAYISFFYRRKKIDLFILTLALIIPLTRLSRIDPTITMLAIACLYPLAPIYTPSRRNTVIAIATLAITIVAASELGTQRHNRFGTYDFKYAEMIKWKPDQTGPGEILPVLYGYTALSFENLDGTIAMHNGRYTYALYSFDWLYSGFLKLNWFTPYGLAQYENYQRERISGAAAVPTALVPFYKDFGPIGIAIPMIIYMCALLTLYVKSSSPIPMALFGLYGGAFGLTSFQALITASPIMHQMALILVIFGISKFFSKSSKRSATAQSYAENG